MGNKRIALTALIVVVALMTFVVRIPMGPAGYFNFGDVAVVFAGLVLGSLAKKSGFWWGAAAGGIGSALADILGGYAVWGAGHADRQRRGRRAGGAGLDAATRMAFRVSCAGRRVHGRRLLCGSSSHPCLRRLAECSASSPAESPPSNQRRGRRTADL